MIAVHVAVIDQAGKVGSVQPVSFYHMTLSWFHCLIRATQHGRNHHLKLSVLLPWPVQRQGAQSP